MIRKVSYRGWNNCYLMENNEIKVLINAGAGGRVMRFEKGNYNIIYENQEQNGLELKDYSKLSFDPDGGRFDLGPERITEKIHEITYMGSFDASVLDPFTLHLLGPPDNRLGIRTERTFCMAPDTAGLTINQRMENISQRKQSYFFWGRTLVNAGGTLFMPVNPESKFEQSWGRYIWGDPDSFAADPDDDGVKIRNGIFTLSTEYPSNEKYGTDSKEGWMAYAAGGLLFIKLFPFFQDEKYGEAFGLTNIFYVRKGIFAEMEPVSPVADLEPGDKYSFSETWYLTEHQRGILQDEALSEAVEIVRKMNINRDK